MKKIIIFGAGETGYAAYKHYGSEHVISFADNNKTGEYCGLPIIGLPKLVEVQDKYDIVIAARLYTEEISIRLRDAGVRSFVVFNEKTSNRAADTEKLASYKGIHKGKRCFIIGTGPSLTMEDLDTLHLHNEICFGTNKIFLAFEKTVWRPDYYFVSDWVFASQYKEELSLLKIENKFVSDLSRDFWNGSGSENCVCFKLHQTFYDSELPPFSLDASDKINQGLTVSYEALQLAVYMGFSDIYYLGVDFDYSKDMLSGENHFAKNYFKSGEVHTPFRAEKQLLAYQKAEMVSREQGFRIFNATRGGKLEVFERVDFDKLFPKRKGSHN
ncbi:MAG: DUF115 domain-containing protein [Clostridiales bacterium]|jgi:uncharacterized Rossmann fold enzyme|nr:DUF115 domain-containing protein [Clostridiales bacterium]